jgi:hypothetical protein
MRAHHSPIVANGMEVPATSYESVSKVTISWVSEPWPEKAMTTTSSGAALDSFLNSSALQPKSPARPSAERFRRPSNL